MSTPRRPSWKPEFELSLLFHVSANEATQHLCCGKILLVTRLHEGYLQIGGEADLQDSAFAGGRAHVMTIAGRGKDTSAMGDTIARSRRSANMSAIRSRNTKPELVVRRMAHAMGYRYRLHRRDLPGKPDLVFAGRRKVIFVHGCFWHQHPDPACRDARLPRSRTGYWHAKLAGNVERDCRHIASLTASGWRVLVIWECEIGDQDALSGRLHCFLNECFCGNDDLKGEEGPRATRASASAMA